MLISTLLLLPLASPSCALPRALPRALPGALPVADVPPVFARLSFREARDKAKAENKLLILDAMTSWCGPCKVMDATTWVDEKVVAWIEANAVAVQLDMDEHTDVKTALGINAFPTVVLLKGGSEFDRVVGLRKPKEFLTWLEDAGAGKRALDRVKEDLVGARAEGAWATRVRLASELLAYSEYDEALVEYMWLWNERGHRGERQRARNWRWGSGVYQMRQLASAHAPARAAFARTRDAIATELASDTSASPEYLTLRRDWIELNTILQEDSASAAWAVELTERGGEPGARVLKHFERRLFALLVREGRWKAAGTTLNDPIASMRSMASNLGAYDQPTGGRASVPMIPMGGMKPAEKSAKASGDEAGDEAGEEAAPKTKPATAPKAKQKSIPAIPMGGMRPAAAAGTAPKAARPAPQTEAEIAVEVRRRLTDSFRLSCAERYAALLAAGRGDEATGVARVLLSETDDARARAALVATVLRAGQLSQRLEVHQRWLDEAAW